MSLTEGEVRDRTKTVTRRTGWRMFHVGDRLTLCRKMMGRRPGEPLERIAEVEVTSVRREPLDAITAADVTAEGFPQMTPAEFIGFLCATHRGCPTSTFPLAPARKEETEEEREPDDGKRTHGPSGCLLPGTSRGQARLGR